MKIIKRLSLVSTLYHRVNYAKPKDSYVERWFTKTLNQYKMTPQQQIVKYGLVRRPRYNGPLVFVTFVAGVLGLFVHLYLYYLYKNQIIVRNKYRVQQIQHSSIKLRVRTLLFKLGNYFQRNLFLAQILLSNQNKNVVPNSEAILRTEQYRNFMKNKDDRFQFLDIGIMQKYPFPDILNLDK